MTHHTIQRGLTRGGKAAGESRKTDAAAWYQLGVAPTRANKRKDARKAFERAVAPRDSAPARRHQSPPRSE